MTARAYTVSEIVGLRKAVTALMSLGPRFPYRESDRIAQIEAQVQTHMLAGHIAEDFQEEIEKSQTRFWTTSRSR